MARYTITVNDSKAAAFLKYLKEFGGAKVVKDELIEEEEITIPKSHQKFVLNRIATAKPKNYISLAETKKRISKARKA
jgi:hypothetical protein